MNDSDLSNTIHAINHHGVFFHAGVKSYFEKFREQTSIHQNSVSVEAVIAEEPCIFEHEKRRADLRVSLWCHSDGHLGDLYSQFELVCECKRVWADKSKFVFFEPTEGYGLQRRFTRFFKSDGSHTSTDYLSYCSTQGCWASYNAIDESLLHRYTTEGIVVSNGNQKSGVKGDKNPLENAANQVCSATWGLTEKLLLQECEEPAFQEGRICMIPVLITNCPLYICRFAANQVSLSDGTLSHSDSKLEEVPWLLYEHPYPRNESSLHDSEEYVTYPDRKSCEHRETIVVVSASQLDSLLKLESLFLPILKSRVRMRSF